MAWCFREEQAKDHLGAGRALAGRGSCRKLSCAKFRLDWARMQKRLTMNELGWAEL